MFDNPGTAISADTGVPFHPHAIVMAYAYHVQTSPAAER